MYESFRKVAYRIDYISRDFQRASFVHPTFTLNAAKEVLQDGRKLNSGLFTLSPGACNSPNVFAL